MFRYNPHVCLGRIHLSKSCLMFFCLFKAFRYLSLVRIYLKFSCNGCSLFLNRKLCDLSISRLVSPIVTH